MSEPFDFIVVGGGHNGLVAACYLARAGRRVVLLEKQPVIGGMSISQPLVAGAPEHLLSPGAIDSVFIRQTPIVEELGLAGHGLGFIDVDPGYGWVNEDGETLLLFKSPEKTAEDIRRFSRKDADNYLQLANIFIRILNLQSGFMANPVGQLGLKEKVSAALKLATDGTLRRKLGSMVSASAYEAIAENFESEALRGLYAYWCAIACPPDTEGSGIYMASFAQNHLTGCSRPVGGMSSLTNAMGSYLESQGGIIKTNTEVARILVENDRTTGVELTNGETLQAKKGVLTACAPQVTFGKLLSDVDCPTSVKKQVEFMPANANNMGPFKIDMAISSSLGYSKAMERRRKIDGVDFTGTSLMTGTLDDHADHSRQVRLGRMGRRPPIWMTILSHLDQTVAPTGQSVAYLYFSIPVDTHIEQEVLRQQASDYLINETKRYMDGLENEIGRSTLMPEDYIRNWATPNACLYHVDMLPTRLGPLRPAKGLGGSKTAIDGLYLAGSGSHPGGGVFGLPGKFAAQAALKAQ